MKDLTKIISNNSPNLGFKSDTNNQRLKKLLIFGYSKNLFIKKNLECDAYIFGSSIKSETTFCSGVKINKSDNLSTLKNTDFILIDNPSDVNFNIYRYKNPIGIKINEKLTILRMNALEAINFDFMIYDRALSPNFNDILDVKELLSNVDTNCFINIHKSNINLDYLELIFDIDFSGIVIDLDTLNKKDFSNLKKHIDNLKEVKDKKDG
ncbi:MAG: hypothetical protein CL703_05095 [Chloroflexi bacterium]|nr:hypothetical protein [Chloroflexota bacterium]